MGMGFLDYTTFSPHVWHLSDFFGSFKQMFRQIDRCHGAIVCDEIRYLIQVFIGLC